MKKVLWLFLFFTVVTADALSIVFVHIGPSIPRHIPYTIAQARKFNPDCPIYLIANQGALASLEPASGATYIPCESLAPSPEHQHFRKRTTLEWSANGFWVYTSERFFYLDEFVRKENLTDVIHLENDILVYADFEALLPVFHAHYPNRIGTTFEKDFRCVPGILYIPNPEPLAQLAAYMSERAEAGDADMVAIGHFKKNRREWIEHLPIVPAQYVADHAPLRSPGGEGTNESESYSLYAEEFQSVFDAASLGIFLGGDDPAFHVAMPGKINPNCVFNVAHCQIEWETDPLGRKAPFLVYAGKKTKINNLHMTNKTLIPAYVGEH